MPTSTIYENKIARLGWRSLLSLWASIKTGVTPDWEPGKAFEYLILRAFQLEGAEVAWPYIVSLDGEDVEQIDGVIYSDGLACLIECKDQNERANIEPVAKLRNQLLRRPGASIGSVFSRSGFTEPAVTLARFVAPQTILLWGGDEIEFALNGRLMRKALSAKFRFCVEHGLPLFNITALGVS